MSAPIDPEAPYGRFADGEPLSANYAGMIADLNEGMDEITEADEIAQFTFDTETRRYIPRTKSDAG